jgi:3-methyl-2-oxobutanoate hydroxymethyltransferase
VKQTIEQFLEMKKKGEKIAMMTAYDVWSARLSVAAGVDCLLVGDSLGMVVLGYDSTLPVTLEDVLRHTAATRRGAPDSFLIADLPFGTYHVDLPETKRNALRILVEGGANAVKLEGGSESRLRAISALVDCEIPVCAHIGLTPQSVHRFGGYKVQGKNEEAAERLYHEAIAVEQAGAFMIVLEGIPETLAKRISESIAIPTIGIGAGRFTDGQVLVFHDAMGLFEKRPKFLKVYVEGGEIFTNALTEYVREVKNIEFPTRQHAYCPLVEEDPKPKNE